MFTASMIRRQLERAGRHPQRARGQNFLADSNVAGAIVEHAGIGADDVVLEVGPGLGSLTIPIAQRARSVATIEIDPHLVPLLEQNLADAGLENVSTIIADAREVTPGELLAAPTAILGNLPYNIGTQLTLTLLDRFPTADRLIVTVQREVADRFVAVPSTKAFGAVTVKIATFGTARLVMALSQNVFVPRPNVASATVRIDRNSHTSVEMRAAVFPLITAGFAHRRKTLRHSLGSVLTDPVAICGAAGIDVGRRAETLELADWCAVARAASLVGPNG